MVASRASALVWMTATVRAVCRIRRCLVDFLRYRNKMLVGNTNEGYDFGTDSGYCRATEEFMKYVLMAGVMGLSVVMISAMLILSVRDEMRQDTREAAATPHHAAILVARS
jgi:hypothetical protein